MIASSLHTRPEDGRDLPLLVWQFPHPMLVASTASSGGGFGERRWIINAQVSHGYARYDLDQHATELAATQALAGPGVTLLTAADVTQVQRRQDRGVDVEATVGVTRPTWAAAPEEPCRFGPGTINIVGFLPVRLSTAAMLNALCTATEAKAQALMERDVPGTGTASDAVTLACPAEGEEEPFCGPRSHWGARLARAVHAAVLGGLD